MSTRIGEDQVHQLKLAHPNAGNPPGKFVVALSDQPNCPLAKASYQQPAWRAIVDELVKKPRYADCFFFYNNGLVTAEEAYADPSSLVVGEAYYLNVLSYNKHLSNDLLASAQLRVITDDSVIETSSEIRTVPPYKDFNIELLATSPGRTRVEICVAGSGVRTSRIKVGVECCESLRKQGESTRKIATQAGEDDTNWRCYRVVRRLRPEDPALLLELLTECFTDEERMTPRIAQEIALATYACQEYVGCAEVLEQLDEQTASALSDEAQEKLTLAYCRARSRFPTTAALSALDYTNSERWARLQATVDDLDPRNAASVSFSMIAGYLDLFVDEHDLGELLTSDIVMEGFTRLSEIVQVVEWLRDCGMTAASYEFALNRLGCLKLREDLGLLRLCATIGHTCGGRGLANVVVALAHRLLETDRPEEAMDTVTQYVEHIPVDDRAYLVDSVADQLQDPCRRAWTYCEAASLYRQLLDIQSAKRSAYAAKKVADATTDEALALAVQSELAEIVDAEAVYGELDELDSVLSTVRIACRDKRIAVVGGSLRLPLLDKLQESVGCEVTWHRSSRETHVGRADALLEGVRKGRTSVVVQLPFSGHSDVSQIESECSQAGVPVVFTRGTNWETVVRAIARRVITQ